MDTSFNPNFYLTTATVIPLFYITLFLQEGNVIQDLAKWVGSRFAAVTDDISQIRKNRGRPGLRGAGLTAGLTTFFLISCILIALMYVILAATVVGILAEGISIWALFYQSDNLILRGIVLWSILGLLAVMSAKPTATVIRNLSWPSIRNISSPLRRLAPWVGKPGQPGQPGPGPDPDPAGAH